ncbi:MAG: DUF1116 domain-containing protein [Solirubrobacterales bacterium]|nr:DUF1116 domain-containing protein [Solirubrobacterales bacterium]
MAHEEILERVSAVNVGLSSFADAVRAQGAAVVDVDWRPPARGDAELVSALSRLWGAHGDAVARANDEVVRRIESAQPCAVTVAPAREVLAVLSERQRVLIHSGTAIEWGRVCDPQRRALIAACLFEEWAGSAPEASGLLASGAVALVPGNEHGHVGPMTGVCSPSMPVWVVEDASSGTRAYSTFNEGPGRTLWFGVGDEESIERLRFFRDELGPLMTKLLAREGPIDVFSLAAQGLQMGDELHMRSQATGNLLIRRLLPGFAALGGERAGLGGERAARFVAGNHHFFLTLTMAAAKCASLAAAGVPGSSVVNLIARNGTDMALQIAGLPGRWFGAPAAPVQDALLRDGYEEADAARDIGDSAVIECIGLGGMAVAAAPAVAAFFGGGAADAATRTELMGQITVARSERFTIPALDFAGSPVGIDARLAAELDITPQITTGVLHVSSGAGQIGAGVAHQPVEPFRDAVVALADALDAAAAGS